MDADGSDLSRPRASTEQASSMESLAFLLASMLMLGTVELPQERTAYFVGEKVLLSVADSRPVTLELVSGDRRTPVYEGTAGTVVLDTTWLAPGEYELSLNGRATGKRIYLATTWRRSAGSLADESQPGGPPQTTKQEAADPALRAATLARHDAEIDARLRDLGMGATFAMMSARAGPSPAIDVMARSGVLSFNNPESRPTSFFPANNAEERDGMTQRMLLTAQLQGRYPNFAGFCVAFDSTGFQPGNRRSLLTYWKWNNATERLKEYLAVNDESLKTGFKRSTGLEWVKPEEYIRYTLAIRRPDMAPAIDLPTQRWLEQMAASMPVMSADEQAAFEKRLDVWSAWLMAQYPATYSHVTKHLRAFDPSLRQTGSVQIDHATVMQGQYLPPAYAPLDFRYQSTWNDQFGAPDYVYQGLFTAGMLDMERPDGQPVWVSNPHAMAHGRSPFPGKFTRVAAQILPHGGSGVGNPLEGFSTMLGGLSHNTGPDAVRDVQSGREFIERFASIALAGRGDHGVGILFSKTQFSRQHVCLAFGTPQFRAFVSLTKMGYTPVFLTEDEIAAGNYRGVKSLCVFGQTVPLPERVLAGLKAFPGDIVRDGGTTADVAATKPLELTLPLRNDPGRPHNWTASIRDATFLFADQHRELSSALEAALAGRGRGLLRTDSLDLTLQQIDGGDDVTYVVASNDSYVKSQADWRQLRERVVPAPGVGGVLYDLTDEKSLGKLAPFDCDMTCTTARLFGIFPREVGPPDVKCRQEVALGDTLPVSVGFDAAGVVPFYLSVIQPDGRELVGGYRSTRRDGAFTVAVRLPVNATVGTWKVAARSQLDGRVTTVPVAVKASASRTLATALADPVVVREKAVVEGVLQRGATVTVPVFHADLLPVAERLRYNLAKRGVSVTILNPPVIVDYVRGYTLDAAQAAGNAAVDSGTAIGRLKWLTVNGNDWFGDGPYRSAKPVIVLQVVGGKYGEIAEKMPGWPRPTPGTAVVQGLEWMFGTRVAGILISATDLAGLQSAADRLTSLPDDMLTTSVREARAELLRGFHIGGAPAQPVVAGLTATAATTASRPDPFVMKLGGVPPYDADTKSEPPADKDRKVGVPSLPEKADFTAKVLSKAGYLRAFVFDMEWDLRFSDALSLTVDGTSATPLTIGVEGVFRYLDRPPMTAPQWEDILAIRAKYYKPGRLPMAFDVLVDGKPAGRLDQLSTGERDVQVELYNPSGGKPRTETEEVVTSITGTVDLPPGKHELLLVHRNIVDGQIARVRVNLDPAAADAIEAERKAAAEAEKKRREDDKKRQAEEKNREQQEAARKAKK